MQGVARHVAEAVEVFCLTDGGTVFDAKVFPDVGERQRTERLVAAGLAMIETEFNLYVLRHAGGIDLVDTGCGTLFGPDAGRMPTLLEGLGIAPDDVTRLIFTHLHGDHVGGALSEGAPVFASADVLVHPADIAHFGASDGPGAAMLQSYSRVVPVEDGADLGHGMRLRHLPGHTPGHSGIRVGDLFLVGDILHSEALQLPDPSICPIYDVDADSARLSRAQALEEIAAQGLVWSGSHMLGPEKFARLARDGDGFRRLAP